MPSYHGSINVTDIRHGDTLITEVRKGSILVWDRSTIRDDFDDGDSLTLSSSWVDEGSSWDHKLGVTGGSAKVQIPDGLLGGFFDLRRSRARWDDSVSLSDDGYVECRMSSRGDGFSLTSLSGFQSQIYGRLSNDDFSEGVGIDMNAGKCSIVRRVSNIETKMADGGNFQPGDRLRLTYVGYLFTLYVNGVQKAQWNDSGHSSSKGSGYRSLGIRGDGGKDLLGPRRFSPAFDYVVMS